MSLIGYDTFGFNNESVLSFNTEQTYPKTTGLRNATYLKKKGYCSEKVRINTDGSIGEAKFGGKCSNCSSSLGAPDYGRTYHLIEMDDASMEYGYLLTPMRGGQRGRTDSHLSLMDALEAVPSNSCFVIDSVHSKDSGAIRGCTDSKADNFDDKAEQMEAGSCIYCKENEEFVKGLLPDSSYCKCKEGFKKPTPKPGLQGDCVKMIAGCTDSKAQNYIPNAEFDDGSCTYKLELCSELNWFEKILKFFKLKECRD